MKFYLILLSVVLVSGLNAVEFVDVTYSKGVTLDCADSTGKWYNVSRNDDDQEKVVEIRNDNTVKSEGGKLVFTDLRRPQIATYVCKSGEKELKRYTLRTNPVFAKHNENNAPITHSIIQGGKVTFTCKLIVGNNNDSLRFEWSSNGRVIQRGDEKSSNDTKTIIDDYVNGETRLTLKIVVDADAGLYTCAARNGVSDRLNVTADKIDFTLRVKSPLAALWPFIGIVVEVVVLCVIIFLFEKKCGKKSDEDESEQTQNLMGQKDNTNSDVKKRSTKA